MSLYAWDEDAWAATGLTWEAFVADDQSALSRTNEIAVPADDLPGVGAGDYIRVGESVLKVIKIVGGSAIIGVAIAKAATKTKVEKVRKKPCNDPDFIGYGKTVIIPGGIRHGYGPKDPPWFICQFGWKSKIPWDHFQGVATLVSEDLTQEFQTDRFAVCGNAASFFLKVETILSPFPIEKTWSVTAHGTAFWSGKNLCYTKKERSVTLARTATYSLSQTHALILDCEFSETG